MWRIFNFLISIVSTANTMSIKNRLVEMFDTSELLYVCVCVLSQKYFGATSSIQLNMFTWMAYTTILAMCVIVFLSCCHNQRLHQPTYTRTHYHNCSCTLSVWAHKQLYWSARADIALWHYTRTDDLSNVKNSNYSISNWHCVCGWREEKIEKNLQTNRWICRFRFPAIANILRATNNKKKLFLRE